MVVEMRVMAQDSLEAQRPQLQNRLVAGTHGVGRGVNGNGTPESTLAQLPYAATTRRGASHGAQKREHAELHLLEAGA